MKRGSGKAGSATEEPGTAPPITPVALTAALWLSAIAVFGLAGMVMDRGWAPWSLLWLAGIGATGLCLSMAMLKVIAVAEQWRPSLGWPVLMAAVLFSAVAQSMLDFGLLRWAQGLHGAVPDADVVYALGFNILVYLWLFALYATAMKLHRANVRARLQEARLLKASAASDRARLEALRYQVNPHFLFNTLNGLQTLITVDRKSDALSMLRSLSAYLRSSLEGGGDDLVALGAELDAVEGYLEVEHARFGERLGVEIDCPAGLDEALVPQLILQPLVENVITHVVARVSAPVAITIACRSEGDDLVLAVADSGAGALATPPSQGLGVGLVNVRDRLRLMFGLRGTLEFKAQGAGSLAQIRQPLMFSPEAAAPYSLK